MFGVSARGALQHANQHPSIGDTHNLGFYGREIALGAKSQAPVAQPDHPFTDRERYTHARRPSSRRHRLVSVWRSVSSTDPSFYPTQVQDTRETETPRLADL